MDDLKLSKAGTCLRSDMACNEKTHCFLLMLKWPHACLLKQAELHAKIPLLFFILFFIFFKFSRLFQQRFQGGLNGFKFMYLIGLLWRKTARWEPVVSFCRWGKTLSYISHVINLF
ncbi:hypothetical protein EPR50_G00118890 [Perca flavescens]|uniref:Uncharacterized protein n=1 Tax=Perca flavescens TaxID=8167 RepID=A0A484CVP3_PERFV|nr:hypothetical protein EPR50_G00118890 [Perca flavescens]